MRRRKGGSIWGRKRSAAHSNSAKTSSAGVPKSGSATASAAKDATDFGQFYDKINARGKCDDLVLLENVSNEGIVEVSACCAATSRLPRCA